MAFKISNEVKVGTMVVVSLAVLILGFNFLRGKGVFSSDEMYYTYYDNVAGLQEAAAVQLQGFKVGKVSKIALQADRKIRVEFLLDDELKLQEGTQVQMSTDNLLAGTKILALVMPVKEKESAKVIAPENYVPSLEETDFLDDIKGNVSPILGTANKAVSSIDSILLSLNSIVNQDARVHINKSLRYLEQAMSDLSKLANALQKQSGNIEGILNNTNSLTANLSNSNQDIAQTLDNLNEFTGQLKEVPLDKTITDLQQTVIKLNTLVDQMNSPKGSVGLMLNDPKLYNNLTTSLKSLEELITDLQDHPSRYINISVFGRKEKSIK